MTYIVLLHFYFFFTFCIHCEQTCLYKALSNAQCLLKKLQEKRQSSLPLANDSKTVDDNVIEQW